MIPITEQDWLCILYNSSSPVVLRTDFRKVIIPYSSTFRFNDSNPENNPFYVAPLEIHYNTFINVTSSGLD
jgi:hypothetical protein